MPPVFGPRSPSKTRLWSRVGAIGRQERPSVSTMKDSSSPLSAVSSKMREPPWPSACFSSTQPIRLHHHGPIYGVERANCFTGRFKRAVERRRGNAVARHELLGEDFAPLEPSVSPRRPHQPQLAAFKLVANA